MGIEHVFFELLSKTGKNAQKYLLFYEERDIQTGIRNKLVLSFLVIALIGLITGGFGYYGVSIGEKAIHDEIGSVSLPNMENLLLIAREAVLMSFQRSDE